MISVDVKSETKISSPIGTVLPSEGTDEPTLSFSELLRGARSSKDEKSIQNGSFLVSLADTEEDAKPLGTKESLLTLLKGDKKSVKEETVGVLSFNSEVTKDMSASELKMLIKDAKRFLSEKIIQSDDFKMAKVSVLPKTLKGLADMAKTFGIDMRKITLEEVRATPKSQVLNKSVTQVTAKEDVAVEKLQNTAKVELEDPVEIKVKTSKVKNIKVQTEQGVEQEVRLKETIKEDVRSVDKRIEIVKEVKATPLFKVQEKTELTTEQIVQTKQFKVEDKTPKSKADETLKLLLRGEKPAHANVTMTADFSVATARVIAPSAITEVSKSFEQLLHGSPEEATSKVDGITTHKADSFEVKLNEAKQMIKYLSQDVKTAIEDYKSPFTRVKVQLNPAKMGEVDVTVIQRGKNLHVNISSNTAAINTLAINANELKTQLSNSGINNASLNFNNNEENSQRQASQQQQNRDNERKADEEYNYFDNEEQNEELVSSLEIVVPNYA